jgi:Asp-tRNA(Asn)/Glu-tRNA(Gln) amidotransferase A subunit family amidase
MARTVTDMAIMLSTVAGPDSADPLSLEVWREVAKRYRRFLTRGPDGRGRERGKLGVDYTRFLKKGSLRGARLGVVREYFGGDPVIDALAEAAIAKMKALGATIVDPVVFDLDALVFPYNASFAGPISNPLYRLTDPTHIGSGGRPSPSTFAGYSAPGFPGIVVPMGFGPQGLPMTISFMGRPYEEGKLIGFAYDYEQATMLRRPSPLVPPLSGEVITYRKKGDKDDD